MTVHESQKTTHMPEGSFLPHGAAAKPQQEGEKRSDRKADGIVFGNHAGDEVCDEVLHGMNFHVLEHKGEMVYIETDYGYRGNIAAKDIRQGSEFSPDYIVTGMFADVLSRPNVRGAIIETLVRGCAVRLVGESDDGFAEIELACGVRGFIRKAFLRPIILIPPETDVQGLRTAIMNSAMSYIGTQYRWGGKSPLGIDCSGLTFMAYREHGITIYRDAKLMPDFNAQGSRPMRQIPRESMKIADLAYLPGRTSKKAGRRRRVPQGGTTEHVAMHIGGGWFVHSSVKNNGVTVDRLEGYPMDEMVVGSVF